MIGSYAHKIEGQSNPQSAHSRNTSQNIKEDSWMDSVYLLREDAELSPRAARRVPLALISPYYEQLKKAMDYFSRQGVEKEIIEQCNHLPVGTYRYKSLSSDPNFTSVNLIQNGKQISLTKKATTLSLKILIRWFFYSHSQLLKFLKIDPEGKSEAHRQALAWLISQVFEGKDGTPILGKISDRTGGGRFEFNKVQNLIIRSIACRRTESKSPGVSIFLLEFWYKNAKPKIWEKIINQCGSFSNLLRKLLIEEEEREKKKTIGSKGQLNMKQVQALQGDFDNLVDWRTVLFPPQLLRRFPDSSILNKMRDSNLIDSKIEENIEERVSMFLEQNYSGKSLRTIESMPQIHIKVNEFKDKNKRFLVLRFLNNSSEIRFIRRVVIGNLNTIMAAAGYIHGKILAIFPRRIQQAKEYSYRRFLKWLEDVLFSNKFGGIPIFQCVARDEVTSTEMVFSKVQLYIIPRIFKTLGRKYSTILGIDVYQHWLDEECLEIWDHFRQDQKFQSFIEEFLKGMRNDSEYFIKDQKKKPRPS